MPDVPDPTPDSNAGPLKTVATFAKGVSGNLLELAKVVLTGQGTPSQTAFFIVGVLGLACIGTFVVFAWLGEPGYLFATFAVMALVFLVTVCLMAWRMGQPAQPVLAPDPTAQNELVLARAELAKVREGIDREAKRAAVLAELRRFYSVGVDAISTHYQRVKNRFPVLLENEVVVTITDDGAAEVTERRKFRVAGKNVQHFLIDRFGGSTAIDSFVDLGFRLVVHSGHTVVWLPAGSAPSHHEVLYAFLPPVKAGDQDVEFSVTWTWPDVFCDLLKTGHDFYSTKVRSAADVPMVRLIFRIHTNIRPIKLSNKGTVPGAETPPLPHLLSPDYRLYQWEARDVPDEGQVAVWLDWA